MQRRHARRQPRCSSLCPTPRSSFWSRSGRISPIAQIPGARNPDGGIHHICYEVDDIIAARDRAEGRRRARAGRRRRPRSAPHNKPVLFLRPKDFNGTLVELEQA